MMQTPWRGIALIAVGVAVLGATTAPAAVRYVDAAAGGGNTGNSWADAYTNLVTALNAGSTASGDDLWVARGIYQNGASIPMKSGVDLYGGFTNGMDSLDQRDWTNHPTLLDGGAARTVILGASGALLDGFVVTNGAAANGAGMYNNGVAPTVVNCLFVNNAATAQGGAVYNNGEAADAVFSNCTFRFNTAPNGGAVGNSAADPAYLACTFFRNAATSGSGGCFYNNNSTITLTLTDTTFTSNSATAFSGVIYQTGGVTLDVSNCVFRANSAANGGVMYQQGASGGLVTDCRFIENVATTAGGVMQPRALPTTTYRRCVFVANRAASGGAMGGGRDSAETFEACTFSGNRASGTGGAVGGTEYVGTLKIQQCVFAGNEAGSTGGAVHTYKSSLITRPVIENCLFVGNAAGTHGGGLYTPTVASYAAPVVRHTTFSGNRAATSGGAYATGADLATVTNCIFWANSAGTSFNEIFEQTLNRADVNYSEVQGGWSGLGGNNLNSDPLFSGGPTGTWTAVSSYDPNTGQTMLTDGNANWTTNQHAGRTVNPNTSQWLQFVIASNTANALVVWGDATRNRAGAVVAAIGSGFQIQHYLPQPESPVVDRGIDIGVTHDVRGAARPVGGGYDPGAYEVSDDVQAPGEIASVAATPLHQRILLTWANPPALDFAGVLLVRRTGQAPTGAPVAGQAYTNGETLGDGEVVGFTNGTRWIDKPLTSGVDYYYRLHTFDGVPNYSAGVITNAVPLDDAAAPGPVSGLSAVGGTGVVTLAWMNPAAADFAGVLVVRGVGADPGGEPVTGWEYTPGDSLGGGVVAYVGAASNATPGASSALTDDGLADDTVYAYRVFAFDPSLNYAAGVPASVATDPDIVPPPAVSGVSIWASNAWVAIAWTNPPVADYAGVLILRKSGGLPTGVPATDTVYIVGEALGDGVVVFNGTGSNGVPGAASGWVDTNVLSGVTYGYVLFARDERPNYASGAGGSVTVPRIVNYVDASATGANNGASWENAFTSLGAALAATRAGTNLWVARGTYSPGSFQLQTNVALYGGFTNGMFTLAERNPAAYPTILSGGGPVVRGAPGARLDGLTVTGGTAVNGGGFYMVGGTITVVNCTFSNNQATFGGGLFLEGTRLVMERCRIRDNRAIQNGGGLFAQFVYLTQAGDIRNTVILGNRCEGSPDGKSDGGGISLWRAPYRIENCTFYDNVTSRRGGGIKLYQSNGLADYVIKNSILWNNRLTVPTTGDSGGWELAIQQDNGVPMTVRMSYTDWSPDQGERLYSYSEVVPNTEDFTHMTEADPAFADAAGGDVHLKSTGGRWLVNGWVFDTTNSPCINAGDPASPFEREPEDNGDRINLGAYGNTEEASRSGEAPRPTGFLMLVK